MRFLLEDIVEACQAEVAVWLQSEFCEVLTDTRKVTEGCLFIALKGEKFNGEDFLAEAAQKGAVGLLVSSACPREKYEELGVTVLVVEDTLLAYQQIGRMWRDSFTMPMVAITGSNGKTTTKDFTAAVLSARGPVLKTKGNFNNEVGIPLTLLAIRQEHKAAVVEIGMRGLGQIESLAKFVKPQIGVVTNVGETHMEILGSLENIAKAKAELVEAIPAGGVVVLNQDNQYVAAMRKKVAAGVRVLTFGIEKSANVEASQIRTKGEETEFICKTAGCKYLCRIPMVGRHNVYNALAAIAVGISQGMTMAEIQRGLMNFVPTGMRFECKAMGLYTVINDAYNASPMSMSAAIDTLADIAKGRKIAVMGDMLELGSVAEEAHRNVGRELAEIAADILLTRGEMGEYIAAGAEEKGMKNVYRCKSHEEAGKKLNELLQPGDTVLFKGSRGMQMEKIIDLVDWQEA